MLSDTALTIIVTAITTAIPATILAVATLVTSLRNGRKVEEIRKSVDGLLVANTALNRSDAGQIATTIERDRGEAKAADLVRNPIGDKV